MARPSFADTGKYDSLELFTVCYCWRQEFEGMQTKLTRNGTIIIFQYAVQFRPFHYYTFHKLRSGTHDHLIFCDTRLSVDIYFPTKTWDAQLLIFPASRWAGHCRVRFSTATVLHLPRCPICCPIRHREPHDRNGVMLQTENTVCQRPTDGQSCLIPLRHHFLAEKYFFGIRLTREEGVVMSW